MLGVVLARKNANALLAKAPVPKFGKSDVVAFGVGDKNNLDPVNQNASFSSVRVRCVQNPRLMAAERAAVLETDEEAFNAVNGCYGDDDVPALSENDDPSLDLDPVPSSFVASRPSYDAVVRNV